MAVNDQNIQLQNMVSKLIELIGINGSLEDAYRFLSPLQPDIAKEAYKRVKNMLEHTVSFTTPISLSNQNLTDYVEEPLCQHKLSKSLFWNSYMNSIIKSGKWDCESIISLNDSSRKVVLYAGAPLPKDRPSFSIKGLVLGYIQSGKTSNYTAVIAKSADRGYRLFIILAGMTESLRRQTQTRLNADLVDLNEDKWELLTTEDGDFSYKGVNKRHKKFLRPSQKTLCVIKKNASRLEKLKNWLIDANTKGLLKESPILIIDDEADQASVNTARREAERKAVNQLIIDIIQIIPKNSFIGYTATPFANVFIDPSNPEDLYPKDFIVDLPKPANYFGPERLFGRDPMEYEEGPGEFGLDIIRFISNEEVDLLQPNSRDEVEGFTGITTPSLKNALIYFWLATACRRFRNETTKHKWTQKVKAIHSSMLIHVTLYSSAQDSYEKPLKKFQDDIYDEISSTNPANHPNILDDLKKIWDDEQNRVPSRSLGLKPVNFDDLSPYLLDTIKDSKIIIANCHHSNYLNELNYPKNEDRFYIVVGGNVLSRGLTLEGLIVSFFIRTSTTYDTLLQMGRWFGFRRYYEDVPRIWMTITLAGYFYDLATVEKEIRDDIHRYSEEHKTPWEFGVRIRTHPVLSITNVLKMQNAVPCNISYGGERYQTISFRHKNLKWLQDNLTATCDFIDRLNQLILPIIIRNNYVYRGIPVIEVLAFLNKYQFIEGADQTQYQNKRKELIKGYIGEQNSVGRLIEWNIVIKNRESIDTKLGDGTIDLNIKTIQGGAKISGINLINRSRLKISLPECAKLKAIMSTIDIIADLKVTPSDQSVKKVFRFRKENCPLRGLLIIYPIGMHSYPEDGTKNREPLEAKENVIGVAVVFPESSDDRPYNYMTTDLSGVNREEEDEEKEDLEEEDEEDEGNDEEEES